MTLAAWGLAGVALAVLAAFAIIWLRVNRIAVRAVHRSRSRIDRFKLTKKPFIRKTLLADEGIAQAVKEHAAENSMSEEKAWARVEEYIDEIVPFFNILTYYKIGMVVSRVVLNFFYKVSRSARAAPRRKSCRAMRS